MTDSTEERAAREYLEDLINAGRAREIMETYSLHGQSCQYVYSIVEHTAFDSVDSNLDPAVKEFARNLLDDWAK